MLRNMGQERDGSSYDPLDRKSKRARAWSNFLIGLAASAPVLAVLLYQQFKSGPVRLVNVLFCSILPWIVIAWGIKFTIEWVGEIRRARLQAKVHQESLKHPGENVGAIVDKNGNVAKTFTYKSVDDLLDSMKDKPMNPPPSSPEE